MAARKQSPGGTIMNGRGKLLFLSKPLLVIEPRGSVFEEIQDRLRDTRGRRFRMDWARSLGEAVEVLSKCHYQLVLINRSFPKTETEIPLDAVTVFEYSDDLEQLESLVRTWNQTRNHACDPAGNPASSATVSGTENGDELVPTPVTDAATDVAGGAPALLVQRYRDLVRACVDLWGRENTRGTFVFPKLGGKKFERLIDELYECEASAQMVRGVHERVRRELAKATDADAVTEIMALVLIEVLSELSDRYRSARTESVIEDNWSASRQDSRQSSRQSSGQSSGQSSEHVNQHTGQHGSQHGSKTGVSSGLLRTRRDPEPRSLRA